MVGRSLLGTRPPGMSLDLMPKVIIMMGQARNGLQTLPTTHCKAEKDQVYLVGGILRIVGYGPRFVFYFPTSLSRHDFLSSSPL